ncbi:MAG: hypothetical protein ACO3J2_08120, partial [Chthoniobacterales bacterium]
TDWAARNPRFHREEEPYRDEVDAIFKQIYREGRFGVLPEKNGPRLVELSGPREQRLDQLQAAIDAVNSPP